MNVITNDNLIKIINEIMNLQGGFDSTKLKIKKKNECWWLLSNVDAINSTGAVPADHIGKTYDKDGVDIIAVLVLDNTDYPRDFEIIKMDGGEIILDMNELRFKYILD